jgi:metal-dependent amidase/aminoacylase/carboxypeptidase family protein
MPSATALDAVENAVRRRGSDLVALSHAIHALPEIGHACGHNIVAASAVGTALALAEVADELGLTVALIGTPAEESGGGKVLPSADRAVVDSAIMLARTVVHLAESPEQRDRVLAARDPRAAS